MGEPGAAPGSGAGLRIQYTSVLVDDQAKAEAFYTEKLGFTVVSDELLGEGHRWLTVGSPAGVAGVELLLEPATALNAATVYQKALYSQGVPCTTFMVEDMDATLKTLKARGVRVTMEATNAGPVVIAQIDDTCGNIVQLTQKV